MLHIDDVLQHRVDGTDDLGVRFITALRDDKVAELGADVDVALLEITRVDRADVLASSDSYNRVSGVTRGCVSVISYRA